MKKNKTIIPQDAAIVYPVFGAKDTDLTDYDYEDFYGEGWTEELRKMINISDDEEEIIPPGNDFYCIGVQVDFPGELSEIIDDNKDLLQNHDFKGEKCEVFQMGSTEIWRYGGEENHCAPFYDAGEPLKIKIEEWDKDTVKATPYYSKTEFSRDIPFVFISEVLNIFEHIDKDYSKPCDAKLACLSCEYDWFESEECFKQDYPSFAVESFFPLIEGDEMIAGAVINGRVVSSEILKNNITDNEYCHFKLACQGFIFDCFAYDLLLYIWDEEEDDISIRLPQPGDIVHGTFKMEVKIV